MRYLTINCRAFVSLYCMNYMLILRLLVRLCLHQRSNNAKLTLSFLYTPNTALPLILYAVGSRLHGSVAQWLHKSSARRFKVIDRSKWWYR